MSAVVQRRGIRTGRRVLVAAGAVGTLWGAFVLFTTVSTHSLIGLSTWLVAAVILHDGILSPFLFGISVVVRRAGRRITPAALAIAQGAVIVGVFFTLVVLPEVKAKQLGTRNPTVLPFDYGLRLALIWIAIAAVAALLIALVTRRAGHRPTH